MGALFVASRLALMMIDYRDFGLGGWDQLVKETTEKYGQPMGQGRTAGWNDGATALSFKHDLSGNIMITLEDLAVMRKLRCQSFKEINRLITSSKSKTCPCFRCC